MESIALDQDYVSVTEIAGDEVTQEKGEREKFWAIYKQFWVLGFELWMGRDRGRRGKEKFWVLSFE